MGTDITTTLENEILWARMDDGKVNAMSTSLMSQIAETLDQAKEAGAVTVLQGRPGIFSAGFDLKTFQLGFEASREMVATGAQTILRFLRHPLPIMTICTGHAYPMGAFLMLSADARWGLEGDWKIGMNETAIAMTIPMFAMELARHRLTPAAFARVATAYMHTPEEAREAGFFDCLESMDTLEESARMEAARLSSLDMPSFAATKERANAPAIVAIEDAFQKELAAVAG